MSNTAPRKWYQAPWFWISGGCCLGCLIVPVACVTIIGTGGFLAVVKSPVVGDALEIAGQNPTLIDELGEPIEQRFFAGNTQLSFEDRHAFLEITIGGPKGTARLSGDAIRRGGVWSYERLEARLESGDSIDLLTGEFRLDDQEYELLPLEEESTPEEEIDPVSAEDSVVPKEAAAALPP